MRWLDRLLGGWLNETVRGWELWITCAVSAAVAVLGDEQGLRAASGLLGAAQLQVGTALMGVVLAAMAILIAFLNDEYVELLAEREPGIMADLAPFQYTAFIGAVSAALGAAMILVGSPEDPGTLRAVLFLALWSFLYLLWIMLDLVGMVTKHARNRVAQIQRRRAEKHANEPPSGRISKN